MWCEALQLVWVECLYTHTHDSIPEDFVSLSALPSPVFDRPAGDVAYTTINYQLPLRPTVYIHIQQSVVGHRQIHAGNVYGIA